MSPLATLRGDSGREDGNEEVGVRYVWLFVVSVMMICGLARAAESRRAPMVVSGAEQYHAYVLSCLDHLETQLPTITRAAEAAAERYVLKDESITQMGSRAFCFDRGFRGGSVMMMGSMLEADVEEAYQKTGVVLVAPRAERLAYDLGRVRQLHRDGKLLIAFGRPDVISQFQQAGAQFDFVIDSGALPHDGMLHVNGRWVVPTEPTAQIAVYWVWLAEFYSACTRLGKQPVATVYYAMPEREAWNKEYGRKKFHDEPVAPIAAGTLATQYLHAVREILHTVHAQELPAIRATAARAASTQAQGGTLYMFFMGYNRNYPCDDPGDPGFFVNYRNYGRADATLQSDDMVVTLGIDQIYQGERGGRLAEKIRAAQAAAAWSLTPYNPDEVTALPAGEIVIGQHCPIGDGVVELPGYSPRLFSGSAVVSETIRWMINAEMITPLDTKGSAQ